MKQLLDYILSKLTINKELESLDTGLNIQGPIIKTLHDTEKVVDFEKYLEQPRLINQTKLIHQLESFIKYIDKYKPNEMSLVKYGKAVIFVALKEKGIDVDCILDYHREHYEPSHCEHLIRLCTRIDESFDKWLRYDNEWLSQKDMINLLKRHNASLTADDFGNLLTSIESVSSSTELKSVQRGGESSNSKAVYFKMLESFVFNFKPYFSIPNIYSVDADLYVQLNDNNRIEIKYCIQNKYKIHEKVADDLRIEFNRIDGIEVF